MLLGAVFDWFDGDDRIDEPAFRLGYTKTKSPGVGREDDCVDTPSQNGFPRLRKRCNYRLI
jgi:hypothetical protein